MNNLRSLDILTGCCTEFGIGLKMAVLNTKENGEDERSNRSFIHVQNLPWSATRSDVRHFFKGIAIKEGGILIRDHDAFVAPEGPLDVVVALFRKERWLRGSDVQLSVVSGEEMRKLLMRNVRRKLDFGQASGGVSKSQMMMRKIRPTAVTKGQKRRALMTGLTFLPEELTPPPPQCMLEVGSGGTFRSSSGGTYPRRNGDRFRSIARTICGAKKLHPTRISDSTDVDNFAVFHPEFCYEVKEIGKEVHGACNFRTSCLIAE